MERKDENLSVVIDETLQHTPETGVFELNLAPASCSSKCWFWSCRGPTFCWGFIKGFFSWILCCFACRKTSYAISDKDIQKAFRYQWPYSKLLEEIQDEKDERSGHFYVLDTTIMNTIIPFSDTHIVGMKAYFSKQDCKLDHVFIPENKQQEYKETELSRPISSSTRAHKKEWEHVKLFLMQGTHHLVKFALHPWSHFPQQTFIDIAKLIFKPDDVLYQALAPHWEFSEMINDNVLLNKGSVLNARKTTCCIFDTQTMPRQEIQKILDWGATKYATPIGQVPDSRFERIYQELVHFGTQIGASYFKNMTNDKRSKLNTWRIALNRHLRYNLDTREPVSVAEIGTIWADFVFKVSVQHSADHFGFGSLDFRTLPMTIRAHFGDLDKKPVTRFDMFKHLMYSNVFVHWINNKLFYDTRLLNAKYKFKNIDPALHRYFTKHFETKITRALAETRHIIPKDCVASSVQW